MLTLRAIEFENWKCYRGRHRLELEPRAYAIVARLSGNDERSNALGKSSIGHAIDYAQFGQLPPDARRLADWITRGEDAGRVRLEYSDGTVVERSLAHGKSEKLTYEGRRQHEAQKALEEALGLTGEDFRATSYFRQRELARLVTCDPADRIKLVRAWLQLDRLRACEEAAEDVRSEVIRRSSEFSRMVDNCASLRQNNAHQFGPIAQGKDLRALHAEWVEKLAAARDAHARAKAENDAAITYGLVRPSLDRYERLVAEGTALAASVKGVDRAELVISTEKANADLGQLQGEYRRLADVVKARAALVTGTFDGQCPVACAACPAPDFVTGARARNEMNLAAAENEAENFEPVLQGANVDAGVAARALREHDAAQARLRAMRQEAASLKPTVDQHRNTKPPAEQTVDLQELARAETKAAATVEMIAEAIRRDDEYVENGKKLQVKVHENNRAITVATLAAKTFREAQYQIAEEALTDVEARACAELEELQIDLSVAIRWGYEGSGLADTCYVCGTAFPKSEKVKQCGKCETKRPPKFVEKLELVPSRRSGGADDLAGFATQLGLSAWLREARNSMWGVAVLDEVFGQLDAAYRRAVSAHLPGVLARAGFGQALVIAHHSSVLDALPGRIVVESDGTHSTARVER